jgi:integrase/recombinase XerD
MSTRATGCFIDGKFGKSREVAVDASVIDALDAYGRLRDRHVPQRRPEAFFLSTAGRRLFRSCVDRTFAKLVATVGLQSRSPGCRPRLHDFRHSFAVRTLLDWHAAGVDVQARLPTLSTYLGHVSPATTYDYLSAAPELLVLVAKRLEPTESGAS